MRLAVGGAKTGGGWRGFYVAAALGLCLYGTVQAAEYRAFWVDAWGTGFLSQTQVDTLLGVPGTTIKGQIRDANCNAVFVQVRRRGDVCYPSAVGEPYFSGLSPSNFNALQAMINAAHDTTGGKQRIEVHAWIVVFALSSGGTTSPVYYQHNDPNDPANYWMTRDSAGNETDDKALDPGHPGCLQYLTDVCMDLVTNFDIDGIHYDYIRFTANNQGYNPTSILRYNTRYGLSGQPASTDEQFKQWRRDQVSALVRRVYAKIQTVKPSVRQSGAFVTWNPSPTSSTRAAFQGTRPYYDVYSDWDSWVQEGIVDMAVPMTYYNWASLPNDYVRWMNFEKDRKGGRHMIIGPGIYLNSLTNAISELLMTRDPSPAGNYAHGFSGYSYRVPYSGGTWSGFSPSLVSQVTPTPTSIPVMTWKTGPTLGHISGTVTLASTGAAADHATVSIAGPVSRSLYVDGTGFYAFIDVPPGAYTITAAKAGYPNAVATAVVAIGEVTGNMYVRDLSLGGNAPPVISAVQATNITDSGATITWTTDVASSSQVEYGVTTAYGGLSALDVTPVSLHSVVLSGLASNTLYHYRVISTGTHGTSTSADYTFTTGGPPQITNVQAVNITPGGATITWTTNAPAGSQVRYGLTSGYGSETPLDPAPVTSHAVALSGLSPSTLYHYQVLSANAYGAAQSGDLTFTTSAVPAEIVIDNTDPGWTNTSTTGNWTTGSSSAVPKIGTNYLYAASTGNAAESSATVSCTWTPTIQAAGNYDVYVYYQIGANRNRSAFYKVVYNGGQVTSIQNQYSSTPNQGGWFLIGQDLPFAAGTSGYVKCANNSTDSGYISADAAKFVYKGGGDTEPPTVPANLTAAAASTTSIQLTWDASTDNVAVTGYNVYRNGAFLTSVADTAYVDAAGLAPNTGYSYEVSAYDAAANESGRSAPVVRVTLSVPPSAATVSCNRSVATWYPTADFEFTAVGGFGAGTVAKYRVAWDQSGAYAWGSGPEADWTGGPLTMTASQPGTWYLHLKGFNAEDAVNGTADLGPYNFQPPPGKAADPSPAHLAIGVGTSVMLSWTPADGAVSHNVYFGTTSPGAWQGNQTAATFTPPTLAPGTTYYWRIDEVNAGGTTTGDVWQFTTATPASIATDFDRDGDVDMTDFTFFQMCFNGANRPYAQPNCGPADLDHDSDVDMADFATFQACFNGPNAAPACP